MLKIGAKTCHYKRKGVFKIRIPPAIAFGTMQKLHSNAKNA